MSQLTFDFPRRTALGRWDFLVSGSNAAAVAWIDRWPDWPSGALVLHGPAGSGKTHLVHLWRERASAIMLNGQSLDEVKLPCLLGESRHRIAIDDADRAPERALLHLHNSCLESRGSLLIAARRSPGSWSVALGDLGSRLRAAYAVGIGLPDDPLLGAVLIKHFADRQLRVAPEVITYLIRHMERSLAAAADIASQLDAIALRDACAITVPLAHRVLAQRGDQALPPGNDAGVT
jgi:chromosomal replication initiation ATPase DnaA